MKVWIRTLVIFAMVFSFQVLFAKKISAAACSAVFPQSTTANTNHTIRIELPRPTNVNNADVALCGDDGSVLDIDANDPQNKLCYRISACNTGVGGAGGCAAFPSGSFFKPPGQTLSADKRFIELTWSYDKSYTFKLESNDLRSGFSDGNNDRVMACNERRVEIGDAQASCGSGTFQIHGSGPQGVAPYNLDFNGNLTNNFGRGYYYIRYRERRSNSEGTYIYTVGTNGGKLAWGMLGNEGASGTSSLGSPVPGEYEVYLSGGGSNQGPWCVTPFTVGVDGIEEQPDDSTVEQPPFILCDQAANKADRDECVRCLEGDDNLTDPSSQKFWTAFGCVETSATGIVQSFLRIGLGLAGGFVLLSILYGAFMLTTSSGDPKRVQEGQEMISSAVMGLLFVIFSIVILQFIGVTILRIPGFGT